MAERAYELQTLPEHGRALSPIRSKEYDAPDTPSKDQLLVPSRRNQSPTPDLEPARGSSSRLYDAFVILRGLLLPLVAIAYLAFCYTVHSKTVPLKSTLFDTSPNNLATIKSGVTSISIIIITLGLFPIHTLVADLRSEEFFRAVSGKVTGAPLYSINGISSPSFGLIESFLVMFRRHSSSYFATALLATFFSFILATLAPAALSVSTAYFDSELTAFAVGAIHRDDFLNTTNAAFMFDPPSKVDLPKASTLAWVENILGVPYGFQVSNGPNYLVPSPVNLPPGVPARWLTDVAVLNPKCEWGSPHQDSLTIDPISNWTVLGVSFTSQNFTLDFPLGIGLSPNEQFTLKYSPYSNLFNITDKDAILSGTSVWVVALCRSGCESLSRVNINVPGIPTIPVTQHNRNASLPDTVFDMAFLICNPNTDIETREVRNDGRGILTVFDTNYPIRQGNLHPIQTNLMLSNVLSQLSDSGGPSVPGAYQLQSEAEARLIFGDNVPNLDSLPEFASGSVLTISPAPIENITEAYTRMLRSTSKLILSGVLSTAYVPGRLNNPQLIFTSSLPQVIISTILFVALCAMAAVSHFRKEIPKFTLFSVAASLDGSNVPQVMGQIRGDAGPKAREPDMVATLGGRSVVGYEGDGGVVLHLQ
ncbi:hypothetical protein BXZ70DRAFT_757390 [Cristinia sonorae]|uniref:Uncharacterized protein n=1 Tax=Cristinia sonorae TaxID=1940300 RepID=A0A8K0XS03_9AGAR|nr:hypothetical protein BXZ70DRAFT_757390 [Cristinia sonorae]